jgi:hypothetical protein
MIKRVVLTIALLMASAEATAGQHRPESFGAMVGAGQSAEVRAANYTAMKACIDSAMTANESISLPDGTIEIDVPRIGSLEASSLRITKNLKMTGHGQNASKLKFGPESPTYRYSAFYVGPNTDVYFKGFTIEGPTNPGPNGEFNAVTCGIRQVGSSSNPSGTVYSNPGRIRLQKIAIAGDFYVGIMGDHGDVSLELTKCDITAFVQCVAWFASFNNGKSLRATKTRFHDAGLGADLEDPIKGHLVYLSPPVSFDINNCRFAGNLRYAIHHYGSSSNPTQYAILQNSTFEATCADGIQTTDAGSTQIINCVFNNSRRGVALKGDTTIQGCTFNSSTGVTTYDIHSGVRVNISGSKFNGGGVITSVWRDCEWRITECEFVGKGSGSIAIANGAAGTQVHVDNCRFSGDSRRGIVAAAGSYFVTGCSFEGSFSEAAVIYDDTDGRIDQMIVNNCSFAGTGQSIWAKNGASNKLSGGGNFFASSQPLGKAGMYQKLELRKGRSPDRLASASTLQPSFNYDSYRVSGTARINSIKLGGSDEVNRMCAGRLELVADGAWSLGEGGNIKPIATGARRVGEVVTLVHHPDAGFWVEVTN